MVLGHLLKCHTKGTCPGPELLRAATPLRRAPPECPHRTAERPPSPRSPQMRQRGTAGRRPGEGIGHDVLLPRQVLDVAGELRDESQLPLLPGGPRLRHPVYGKRQQLPLRMLNSLPCSMLRKCLTARYAASNSLSKAEYFCWAASNFC